MRLPRVFKTPSFRLTVMSVLLFSLAALLVFSQVYWASTRFMMRQMDHSLAVEMASLQDAGRSDLAIEVGQRLAAPSTREFYYLLEDARNRRLAGNLPPMDVQEGWEEQVPFDARSAGDDESKTLRVYGKRLPDGSLLAVARNIQEVDDVSDFMENSFAIGFVITLALAFVCGGLVSAGFLKRLDAITRISQDIMGGDLHRRIPPGSDNDDFAGLSQSLNAMLDRIQELMEEVQQVSNDIAHDLRTPLTRLRHGLERAQMTTRSVEELNGAINGALDEADNLLEVFSALLRIAQIETGARRSGFVELDLSEVTQMMVETYAPVAEDDDHILEATIEPGILVKGDRHLLTQMLANLVENALRHTPSGSTVTIHLRRDGGPVLSIADNGPGIPKAERIKVFHRFYRLDASRSTPGSGLGLSMVAAIVSLHGGDIVLADNSPGLRVAIGFQPLP